MALEPPNMRIGCGYYLHTIRPTMGIKQSESQITFNCDLKSDLSPDVWELPRG
jgi:hypothetical protein